jgi:hypothetical protein
MQTARIGRAERAAAEHAKRRIAEPQLRCVTAQDDTITMTATQGLMELEAARVGRLEAGRFNDAISAMVTNLLPVYASLARSARPSSASPASSPTKT